MKAKESTKAGQSRDRHILVALDESENSKRALLYVADYLGGVPGFRLTLLHVIPTPPDDYFDTDRDRDTWLKNERDRMQGILENYRAILTHSGFKKNKVDLLIGERHTASLADSIIEIQKRLNCCTIVVGRRGISKKEEFIFGSTSNKILHTLKNCAIWVIE